jgi:hypothetical protein
MQPGVGGLLVVNGKVGTIELNQHNDKLTSASAHFGSSSVARSA